MKTDMDELLMLLLAQEREKCAKIAERGASLLFPAPRSGRIIAQNVSQAIAACIRGMAPLRAAQLNGSPWPESTAAPDSCTDIAPLRAAYEEEKGAWVAAHPNCTAREYAEAVWAIKKRMGL